jgi:hypothetical protein
VPIAYLLTRSDRQICAPCVSVSGFRHCDAKPGAGGLSSRATIPASPLGGSTLRAASRRLSASTVDSARSVPSESPASASRSRSKTAPASACTRSSSTGSVRSSVTTPECPVRRAGARGLTRTERRCPSTQVCVIWCAGTDSRWLASHARGRRCRDPRAWHRRLCGPRCGRVVLGGIARRTNCRVRRGDPSDRLRCTQCASMVSRGIESGQDHSKEHVVGELLTVEAD